MKTSLNNISACFLLSASLLCGEPSVPVSDKAPSPGNHFFVGVDINVKHGDGYYPIEKIWNQTAHINVDGKMLTEDIRRLEELRYFRQTKISKHFAEIANLECEPGYSIHRDPEVNAARSMIALGTLAADAASVSDSAIRRAESGRLYDEYLVENNPGGPGAPEPGSLPPMGESTPPTYYYSQFQQMQQQMLDIQRQSPDNRPAWDLLNISFQLEADHYFPSGHLVFIFQLKEAPEEEPTMTWFHFLTVKDISTEAKSYDYKLQAYPDGMYIDSYEVLLFANGTEIATNYSPKHVEMTDDDARTFVQLQYLAKNSGKTRPPQRAWKYLDPEIGDRVKVGLEDETILLKLDEEGIVTDITMSPAVQRSLSSDGIQELSTELYLPALENGKPVAGELALRLADIVF